MFAFPVLRRCWVVGAGSAGTLVDRKGLAEVVGRVVRLGRRSLIAGKGFWVLVWLCLHSPGVVATMLR
jgi:hypothetical protein